MPDLKTFREGPIWLFTLFKERVGSDVRRFKNQLQKPDLKTFWEDPTGSFRCLKNGVGPT